MSTINVQDAWDQFCNMDDKQATDVAYTYLLGVLEMDRPEDIEQAWRADFPSQDTRAEADKFLRQVVNQGEGRSLLHLAVETGLECRPETNALFIESVRSAGEKMWVVELGFTALVAAHLLRELWIKGRAKEKFERTTTSPDGTTETIRKETVYAKQSGTLGKLMGLLFGVEQT